MNGKSLIVAAATATLLWALSAFSFAGAGTSGAAFLRYTPGPRATGMGESYTAVGEDAYSNYWNPAGLASVDTSELAATYNRSFQDIAHQYVAAAFPLSFGSTLGLSFTRLSVDAFQGYDALGTRTRQVEASDMAIGAAYARTILADEIQRPVLNAGVNVKLISSKLDNASASALAADVGAVYYLRPSQYWMRKIPAQELRIAFTARNVGTGMKFDKVSFPLPTSYTLGTAWYGHPWGANQLVLSMDHIFDNEKGYMLAAGAEYAAFQLMSVRAGYKSGQDEGSGLRVGFGFKLAYVDVDYSFSPFGDLGAMHKMGVTWRFGTPRSKQPLGGAVSRAKGAMTIAPKPRIEKLRMFANDFVELAKTNITEGSYLEALDNFNNAFNLQPSLKTGEWGGVEKRLAATAEFLRLRETPARETLLSGAAAQPALAHRTITAYAYGEERKAFLLAHAALGTNLRGDAVYEELMNAMSSFTRMSIRRDELLPFTALVREKLKNSAKAFYIRQFDLAVRECEEATLLDEKNHLAWTRLGSAYYLMGDKEKAKKAYLKAVELDPKDAVTLDFLKKQGWK